MFADEAEVVFASHHWPTWGGERIVEFLVACSATSTPTCTTRPCGC